MDRGVHAILRWPPFREALVVTVDEFDEIAFRLAEPDWDPGGGGLRVTPATLAATLRDVLRDAGLVDVEMTGTVTGVRQRARVVTFEVTETLPGDSTPLAVVPVVAFGDARRAAGQLVDGSTVRVSGYLEWKPDWGQLRVIAQHCEVVRSTSEVEDARARLVRDLRHHGLLSRQGHLVLVARPRRVVVVTGCGSAAEGDIRSGISAGRGIEVDVRYAPMSGSSAAGRVARELEAVANTGEPPDLILIARGGGARSDLDWADAEVLARSIATCPVPVWTALGHATDSTVADLVASRSCATPSAAAAELVDLVRDDERRRLVESHAVDVEFDPRFPRLHLVVLVAVVLISLGLVVALLS